MIQLNSGNIQLYEGDCLEIMKQISDKSVDLILCDLPYGTLACKWDVIIPFDKLWEQYDRIIKDDGIICLFGSEPFTSSLIMSNTDLFRYKMIWKKESPTGFLNSAYKPLSMFEDIVIFSKATVGSLSKVPIRYYPQGVVLVNKQKQNNPNSNWREKRGYSSNTNKLNSNEEYTQKYTNLPKDILEFPRDKNLVHPAQKPIELLEYLIKTYTKEGELVLDNTMGSGSTGVACKRTDRNFIGIEKDPKYFDIAKHRINGTTKICVNKDTQEYKTVSTVNLF